MRGTSGASRGHAPILPQIWFIQLNGLPYDARELPVEIQAEAYRQGVIPYIPDLGRDGTAAAVAVLRS